MVPPTHTIINLKRRLAHSGCGRSEEGLYCLLKPLCDDCALRIYRLGFPLLKSRENFLVPSIQVRISPGTVCPLDIQKEENKMLQSKDWLKYFL